MLLGLELKATMSIEGCEELLHAVRIQLTQVGVATVCHLHQPGDLKSLICLRMTPEIGRRMSAGLQEIVGKGLSRTQAMLSSRHLAPGNQIRNSPKLATISVAISSSA